MTFNPTVIRIRTSGGPRGQMKETIRRVGAAIRAASVYPPIRNYAAAIASTAPPKDFAEQLRRIYQTFVTRWRYVKDPVSRELVTWSPEAVWKLTIGGDGIGVGAGYGAGDCDCATVALGAQLESIGFKTRLGTTASPNLPPGELFGHIFIQAELPKVGWITLDPVLHPRQPFGATAVNSRIAFWDLDGNLLGAGGNYTGIGDTMGTPNLEQWQNYGFGDAEAEMMGAGEPAPWESVGLAGWGWMPTPSGRISAVETYGIINGEMLGGIGVEVGEAEEMAPGLVRTPMLSLSLGDYQYVQQNGVPYHGMPALGDTGEVYAYDGLGGFFKKLFKRIRKGVKKIASRIRKGIRKVLKKSKFGRFLLKVGGKIRSIAMKVVRPLMKFVGKWAGKLAPIAALVPGYGTAVAAALTAAGKVANVMKRWGVTTTGKKGSVRQLKLQDPKKLPEFKRELEEEAKQMAAMRKSDPNQFQKYATALRGKQ